MLLLQLLTSGTLRVLHLLSQLLGLTAASWQMLSGRVGVGVAPVKCERYWRLHGCLVLLFVLGFSPVAMWMVITRMDFLRQNHLLLMVGCHRYALLLGSAVLTLYRHTSRQCRLIVLANKLLWCCRQLFALLHTSRLQSSAHRLHTRDHLTIYALAVSIACSCSYTVFLLRFDVEAHRSSLFFCAVLFVYVCQLCLQLSLALYLLALLLISHLSHHCNLLLAQLLADAVHSHEALFTRCLPHRQRLLDSQQRWLALELWRLLRLHRQLLRLSLRLCSLHNVQLVLFVIFVAVESIMHSFFSYFVTFSNWWLRKFHEPAPWNVEATVFNVAVFVQLTLVIGHTHRLQQIFRKTRYIFSAGVKDVPVDCSKALSQTLHLYGLQLQVNERVFHLLACGLFKLNNSLLFGIVQTIIMYTIILIQFDKIMNR
ncbi:putative gustatory receptor 77a [Drosophila mojavensis]|uniref:Gustatory receptor n=1 Tax=Drosophila mojavensis TaxID=7230 RepID=B4KYG2_DROMO|nr:putative gustatory receptor 77a [Drosophila mojavensis]EDW18773.1 uncharacterized protein Dmoj_GI11893 [Drosophila mojavensis]